MCSSALGCIAQAQEEDPRVLTACVRAPLRKSLPPYKSSYHSALRTFMKGIAPLVWMSCLVLGCERGKDCGDPLPPNAANVECGCMAVSDTGQDSTAWTFLGGIKALPAPFEPQSTSAFPCRRSSGPGLPLLQEEPADGIEFLNRGDREVRIAVPWRAVWWTERMPSKLRP